MSLLLHNAFVHTGEAAFANGAILIEDGRVAWSGALADLPPDRTAATRRDLGGRVVIPGLVNAHTHGGLSACRCACDDGDLFQWAAALRSQTSHLTIEDNRQGCRLAVAEMLRNGITTACDCTRYGAGVFAEVASEMGLRSLSGALANSPELRPAGRPNWPLALDETDEAMARHGADGLARFYLGAHSPYSCTPDLLIEVKSAARERGLPFVIHASENRAETRITLERYGATPIRHLHRLGLLDRSTVLAHCVWVDEEEIDILAETGAAVVHNPASNAKLASGIAPVSALRRAGVPVGLGTDSVVSNNRLDLFQEMKLAVLLQRVSSLDGFAMNAADAFRMATSEGARTLGMERETGRLLPGMAADLVVLEIDHPEGLTPERVVSDLVYRITPREVRDVMVAGRFVVEHGALTLADDRETRPSPRRGTSHPTGTIA
ncbi:amidohydrolase [Aureimonas flava]|uniref:Amidohydrolase n=1 Tax=Aureimonas flava TaxID=2320271 RepID=A0A3A1WK17_9HYPH|nr:amidohydrolase [Aureimonas flava]RIY00250.1 amidohydrolase [Aureimonas flava]